MFVGARKIKKKENARTQNRTNRLFWFCLPVVVVVVVFSEFSNIWRKYIHVRWCDIEVVRFCVYQTIFQFHLFDFLIWLWILLDYLLYFIWKSNSQFIELKFHSMRIQDRKLSVCVCARALVLGWWQHNHNGIRHYLETTTTITKATIIKYTQYYIDEVYLISAYIDHNCISTHHQHDVF